MPSVAGRIVGIYVRIVSNSRSATNPFAPLIARQQMCHLTDAHSPRWVSEGHRATDDFPCCHRTLARERVWVKNRTHRKHCSLVAAQTQCIYFIQHLSSSRRGRILRAPPWRRSARSGSRRIASANARSVHSVSPITKCLRKIRVRVLNDCVCVSLCILIVVCVSIHVPRQHVPVCFMGEVTAPLERRDTRPAQSGEFETQTRHRQSTHKRDTASLREKARHVMSSR